ncbi:hypothetical protein AVEN_243937-1 [Araneus ventricosus]|uniref:Uncharacterized protein n=1 Tax=Araneus ventricosus TaxID=182803 RepID=A0A4Y2RYN8_ARAVE|nr:hypothetical protein AVEN_243937-1 [Araneus ventricosus]
MMRTTPELASPSPNFHATPTGGRFAAFIIVKQKPRTRLLQIRPFMMNTFEHIRVKLTVDNLTCTKKLLVDYALIVEKGYQQYLYP